MTGLNRDEIIRVAKIVRKAHRIGLQDTTIKLTDNHLEHFANLIAAAERETCAKVCEQFYTESDAEFYRSEFASAIRARGQE